MGKVIKGVGKLIGIDYDGAKQAAEKQAAATTAAASQTAQANRDAAQQAQRTQETMLAQKSATDRAAELLAVPQADADVALSSQSEEIDPVTGQRKRPREAYSASGSGLNI